MVNLIKLGLTHPSQKQHIVNNIVESQPPCLESVKAIADSGAKINLGTLNTLCQNLQPIPNDIHAKLPDGSVIQATQIAVLNLPGLSETARTLHSFPQLQVGALLSLGALSNGRCEIILTNNALYDNSFQTWHTVIMYLLMLQNPSWQNTITPLVLAR
jgi:hypothetical protein